MEKKEKIILLILFFCILLFQVEGSAEAQGGNITPLIINVLSPSEYWQGFAGRINIITPSGPTELNATPGNVSIQNFNIKSPCKNPSSVKGYIIFSNSSSNPAGLVPGNLTKLQNFMGAIQEKPNETFAYTTNFPFANNVPTTYTYVNNVSQNFSFREGYFNDNKGNILFIVEIDRGVGYNGSVFDFQAILPTNKSAMHYYVTTNLAINCPTPGPSGGGGTTYHCNQKYECSDWSSCQGGIQSRTCSKIGSCRGLSPMPSLSRKCAIIEEPKEIDLISLVDQIRSMIIGIDYTEELCALIGSWMKVDPKIWNKNDYSMELVETRIKFPVYWQKYLPLHFNPIVYSPFRLIPREKLEKNIKWESYNQILRINPDEEMVVPVKVKVPITDLRKVPASLEIYSGEVYMNSMPIAFNLKAPLFAMDETRNGTRMELEFLIDNRGHSARTVEIEVDFNKGRNTRFTELYEIDLPADEILIYGYVYKVYFEYDKVKVHYWR